MKNRHLSKYWIVYVAVAVGVVMVVGTVMAAKGDNSEKLLDKVSRESSTAMQDLHSARVAIFDGQLDSANRYLSDAKKNLAVAEKQAPELVVSVKAKETVGKKTISSDKTTAMTDYVPVDARLIISEDYVPTPEKNAKIKEADKHLKKGDSAKALEVLREADIDVSVSRLLMPLKPTVKDVNQAIDLMKAHKYYEANLAIKGAEDGLIVDTVQLDEPVPPAKNAPAIPAPARKKSTSSATQTG